jgi:tryptophan synthase alpha subunit
MACGFSDPVAVAIVIALAGERALSLYFTVSSILTGGVAGLFRGILAIDR